jgi:L-aspartate oxidase
MGGIKVNIWGETNIAGLFAAGETACTGVHGANRLASNSLLEVVVFSKRIIERTREADKVIPTSVATQADCYHLEERKKLRTVPQLNLSSLQSLLWDKVGIVRSGEELSKAADILATWQDLLSQPTDRPSYELNNMILNARLMTEAALLRQESRGAHFRTDFPRPAPDWKKHIVFKAGNHA